MPLNCDIGRRGARVNLCSAAPPARVAAIPVSLGSLAMPRRQPLRLTQCRKRTLSAKQKPGLEGPGLKALDYEIARSGREGLEPLGKPRNFPRRSIAVQHSLGGGAHQFGLRGLEC